MAKRIVLTGGGSGGHIFPLVAVSQCIKENYWEKSEFEFLFLGPVSKMEQEIMGRFEIPYKNILAGKIRRYFSFHYITDFFKFFIGFFQALWQLFVYMPDVVYAKGGYASVPVVIAARIFRIPVLIHESDAFPGLANRFLGSIANKVAICFSRAQIHFPPSRTVLTGMPVRSELLNGDKQKAIEQFNLRTGKPVIFFIGGSQGAMTINNQIIELVNDLLEKYIVIHQTGIKNFEEVCQKIKEKGIDIEKSDYRPMAFIGEEMKDLLALADIVVSRAGSSAIAEIAANKKPAILIPITKSANNHQRINAYEVAKAGGAIVLEEENFKRGMLLHNLHQILSDSDFKAKLSENVAKFYQPEATKLISDEVIKLIKL